MSLWKLFKTPEIFCGGATWKRQRSAKRQGTKTWSLIGIGKIEQLLRNEILTAFPRDSIVGEEYRRRRIAPGQ